MKVAVLVSSVSRAAGGLFNSVRGLSGALVREGVQVTAFSMEDAYTREDLPAWDEVPVRVFPPSKLCPLVLPRGLARDLREFMPDIVHSHGLWECPSTATARWARATGRPYVASPHGMLDPWALRHAAWKKRLARLLYENAHLRGASCIHALTTAEAEAVRDLGFRNPVCVVPNGITVPEKLPTGNPPWKERVPEGRKVLLYLGRLHPKKGLANLLRAWADIRGETAGREDEWMLVIAGWDQGNHERYLRRMARDLNIEDTVLFPGAQHGEDKHRTFMSADAFILPSLSEGLPMAVLEAWSYSLPVLMTDGCHLPEGFSAGAAIHVEPEPRSIAGGISSLMAMDISARRAMGAKGLALVREQFAWPRVAAKMKSVYEWILGGGDTPDCVMR